MKVLIVSDSHFENEILDRITKKYCNEVDLMIHCGDSSLPLNSPFLNNYLVVKGNHDESPFPIKIIKKPFYIIHGQTCGIYKGYDELIKECQQNHCTICFHGHTHVPTHQFHQGIHFINPGSIMINRGSYGYGTYAIAEIDHNDVKVHFYHHQSDVICDEEVLNEGIEMLEEFKKILKKEK